MIRFALLIACLNGAITVAAQENVHTFIYDSATGRLKLDSEGQMLTVLQMDSQSRIFTGPIPPFMSQPSPAFFSERIIHLDAGGFDDLDFGPVIAPGYSLDFLKSDLTIRGALMPSGGLGQIEWVLANPSVGILHYDAATGGLSLTAPSDVNGESRMTSVVIDSPLDFFTGQRPATLTGEFDLFRSSQLFKMDVSGFGSVDFGPAAAAGWTDEQVVGGVCIAGSLLGGGRLPAIRLNSTTGPLLQECNVLPDLGGPIPNGISLDYDPATGRLWMTSSTPSVTALELFASEDLFTGQRPGALSGLFDVYTPNKLFFLKPGGVGSLDFGFAMAPGLSPEQLSTIRISGAILGQGGIGEVTIRYATIPEPGVSVWMSGVAYAVLRKRRRLSRARRSVLECYSASFVSL